MKVFARIACICLALVSAVAHGGCVDGAATTLVYGNGIATSRDEAEKALFKILEPAIAAAAPSGLEYTCWVAYDSKILDADGKVVEYANLAAQLLDAASKRGVDLASNFWPFWWSLIEPPPWFLDIQRTFLNVAITVLREDLEEHIAYYRTQFDLGHRLVVVAHSEGNLYVNKAYEIVTGTGGAERFHVVAVATPAATVPGNGDYFTLRGDVIDLVPFNKEWNRQNDSPPCPAEARLNAASVACHSFVDSYMAGNKTSPEIVETVVDLLTTPPPSETCNVATPVVPCTVGTTTYDTFVGNYSNNRSFYRASSYDVSFPAGAVCLTIKPGLPHTDGHAYVRNYGPTVWTSPAPYNVNFGVFGQFSGSCVLQADHFEWFGLGAPNASAILDQVNDQVSGSLFLSPGTLAWQQGITTGVSGRLSAVDIYFSTAGTYRVSVNPGAPWQNHNTTDDFFATTVSAVVGWNRVFVESAEFPVTAGTPFMIHIRWTDVANQPGLGGTGATYPGGGLYLNGSPATVFGGSSLYADMAFKTYVVPQ